MTQELAPQSSALMSAEDMQKNVDRMNSIRQVMNKYVEQNLTADVDFGRIHINKDCKDKYSPKNCKVDSHWSKPSLFKPGSEKMCTLFQIRPMFKLDQEAREMAGNPTGTFFYLCELIGADGRVWGEGRGSCSIDTRRDSNSAVKIAEKRAQVDAILRTFAMSDRFTQDLEDMDVIDGLKKKEDKPTPPPAPVKATTPSQTTNVPPQPPRIKEPNAPATDAQLKALAIVRSRYGMTEEAFKAAYKVKSTKELTKAQASRAIEEFDKRLKAGEQWQDPSLPQVDVDADVFDDTKVDTTKPPSEAIIDVLPQDLGGNAPVETPKPAAPWEQGKWKRGADNIASG